MPPHRRSQFHLPSAAIGAASAAAALLLLYGRPKDPTVDVTSITLSSFNPRDLNLTVAVHVTNPNLVPVVYSPAAVSISYRGAHLGSAFVPGGSQPPLSCRMLRLGARLDGTKMGRVVGALVGDVARREVRLDADVEIKGVARLVWFLKKRFCVRVGSSVTVDPVFLEVVGQENVAQTRLLLPWL